VNEVRSRATPYELPASSDPQSADSGGRNGAQVSLTGRWLVAARLVGLGVAVLSVGLFAASLPAFYDKITGLTRPELFLVSDDLGALRIGLEQLGLSLGGYAIYRIGLSILFVIAFASIAGLIFWRRPDEPMALLLSVTLAVFGAFFPSTVLALSLPVTWLDVLLRAILGLAILSFFLLFYVLPDGRFVPSWTRPLAAIFVAAAMPGAFLPGSAIDLKTYPAANGFFLVGVLGSVVLAQVYRYRRVSGPIERQQTKWIVFGIVAAVAGWFATFTPGQVVPSLGHSTSVGAVYEVIAPASMLLSFLAVPVSMAFAVLRHRLYDIDVVVNRTLVYGALTVSIVGLYVLVVGSLGTLFQLSGNVWIGLLATGLAAVLFQPLRDRLQRDVNRLFYGERDNPYAVLSGLGRRLEATLAPDDLLSAIVETVARALNLPSASIAVDGPTGLRTAASYGQPLHPPLPSDCVTLPLSYQGQAVGHLLLAPRSPAEPLTDADRQLLDALARHVAVVVQAMRLTADLRRSRQGLVTAREEERRRLRRDLHDGLGPALASMTLQAEAAREALPGAPAEADMLLADLAEQLQAATAEIRRLVYALGPPALDDLGLIPALRAQAARYEHGGLRIAIDAPDIVPPLPAAVEVATYRIAQEALTNAVRHARARSCTIRLTFTDGVKLEIADDGVGLPAKPHVGVGLASMRERASELGGSCVVEALPMGGTLVSAAIPCTPLGTSSSQSEASRSKDATPVGRTR